VTLGQHHRLRGLEGCAHEIDADERAAENPLEAVETEPPLLIGLGEAACQTVSCTV
jgi:hypothetical protein